jgi:hypothetical protein
MPLVLFRAADLGVAGDESPATFDANAELLARIEAVRRTAGRRMGLGDVAASVVPKPVIVSTGHGPDSITSRYFTPWRCHASHAVTGAIGVATAFALPGTVASGDAISPGQRVIDVLHPQGRIAVEVDVRGRGGDARVERAALLRTARKILQGELHLPPSVYEDIQQGDMA